MRHHFLPLALCLSLPACGGWLSGRGGANVLPSKALLISDDKPALFLTQEPGSAQIGYVSDQVTLELTGSVVLGRVPVRIDGALRTRGFVAADQLSLRVQRRGRIRGAPVYVGPNDRVRVLGRESADRARVEVTPRLGPRTLGRFEGSYPNVGLKVSEAPASEAAPDEGVRYRVPAQMVVTLFEQPVPTGAALGSAVAELAASPEPYEVRVIRAHEGWLALRVGSGPYLIGWTQAALLPVAASTEAANASAPVRPDTAQARVQVPARLANEAGELRRVAPGTKMMFGDQVIGVFQVAGWARVLREYPGGYVDVFAAADDNVALRGVVRSSDLTASITASVPAAPVSERSTTGEARSPAP